jgi:hypothetical protein
MEKTVKARYLLVTLSLVQLYRLSLGQEPSDICWPFEPQTNAHQVAVTYGDWNPAKQGLHPGVDLPSSVGARVKVVKNGYITDFSTTSSSSGGYVVISDAVTSSKGWLYGHLDSLPEDIVNGSKTFFHLDDYIGNVVKFQGTSDFDHLHFAWSSAILKVGVAPGFANPLQYLTPQPNSKPLIHVSPYTGKPEIRFVPDKSKNISQQFADAIAGKVDIIVRASTTIEDDERPGVYKIGYEIADSNDSLVVPFRMLMEFKGELPRGDSEQYKLIYFSKHWFKNTYIVTNCGPASNPGGLGNVQESCWDTEEFEDGLYKVRVKAWDVAGNMAVDSVKVKVSNNLFFFLDMTQASGINGGAVKVIDGTGEIIRIIDLGPNTFWENIATSVCADSLGNCFVAGMMQSNEGIKGWGFVKTSISGASKAYFIPDYTRYDWLYYPKITTDNKDLYFAVQYSAQHYPGSVFKVRYDDTGAAILWCSTLSEWGIGGTSNQMCAENLCFSPTGMKLFATEFALTKIQLDANGNNPVAGPAILLPRDGYGAYWGVNHNIECDENYVYIPGYRASYIWPPPPNKYKLFVYDHRFNLINTVDDITKNTFLVSNRHFCYFDGGKITLYDKNTWQPVRVINADAVPVDFSYLTGRHYFNSINATVKKLENGVVNEVVVVKTSPAMAQNGIETALCQNHPNPFVGGTNIKFQLGRPGQVHLRIYNISGQLVKTLVNNALSAGIHQCRWDGTDDNGKRVSKGVYLYKLTCGAETATKKMVFLR